MAFRLRGAFRLFRAELPRTFHQGPGSLHVQVAEPAAEDEERLDLQKCGAASGRYRAEPLTLVSRLSSLAFRGDVGDSGDGGAAEGIEEGRGLGDAAGGGEGEDPFRELHRGLPERQPLVRRASQWDPAFGA